MSCAHMGDLIWVGTLKVASGRTNGMTHRLTWLLRSLKNAHLNLITYLHYLKNSPILKIEKRRFCCICFWFDSKEGNPFLFSEIGFPLISAWVENWKRRWQDWADRCATEPKRPCALHNHSALCTILKILGAEILIVFWGEVSPALFGKYLSFISAISQLSPSFFSAISRLFPVKIHKCFQCVLSIIADFVSVFSQLKSQLNLS